MGAGVFLAVVGAILAFAIRADVPGVDLPIVGLILMIAGGAVILHARRGSHRERVVTHVDDNDDPTTPSHTVQHTVQDRDID